MKYLRITYFIILILIFSNVIIYKELNSKINELNINNQLLQEQVSYLEEEKENSYIPRISMTYTDQGDYNKVLVVNECNLHALPIEDFGILRPIEANTAVPVLDTAISSDNNIWLYVETQPLDTPINYKGWIQESDIVRLTEENRYKAINVAVDEGTPVYEGYQVGHIKSTEHTILAVRTHGIIGKIHEEWVNLTVGGGRNIWVNKKDIIYPTIN